ICTAQVLLANIASMYAVYHGPRGLAQIANRVHHLTATFANGLKQLGYTIEQEYFFDSLTVQTGSKTAALHTAARSQHINLREITDSHLGLSF
ncbi:hypothetical protein, partial [Pseudomonas viridiflava]|uniref:hypothetical protein n=1 Tax=Pseudomonas viridiflava TaxID=33069 RepID=UPI0013DFF536